jgi:Holliday junction resolvasome RuvABC endonuclease subunit
VNLISLDLGAKCGWASISDGVVNSGTKNLSLTRFEGRGMQFLKFKKFLNHLAEAVNPELVTLEEVRRHLGVDAAHAYGGYLAHVTAFCSGNIPEIPFCGVPVGTIKKHATGKGNASKSDMIAAAEKLFPDQTIEDDNQADALCLLNYTIKEII